MEIDNNIVEIIRTCLKEEWKKEEVTDEQVKFAVEGALLRSIYQDFKLFQLPETKKALSKYYEEKGFPVEAFAEQGENNGN